ncbi:unnamed protein product [Effrenium voratum]|uniref:PPM-type phosphatase domain-containing protein n=1 Tax=Effrenium voratum TaxID=2562239 RepID=A0AA36HN40_9DINO|nr:unnamed protein product [Effrenium voratum]CAJ1452324.1 unnamed protein product [Effrenium voratum]
MAMDVPLHPSVRLDRQPLHPSVRHLPPHVLRSPPKVSAATVATAAACARWARATRTMQLPATRGLHARAARVARRCEWPAGAGPDVPGCGMVSAGGVDPDRPKVNQDACYVAKLPDGRLQAMVLDGHGKKGHVVAGALKALLPALVAEGGDLSAAFRGSDAALRAAGLGRPAYASGAAAIAAVIRQGEAASPWEVQVACSGDCRAWLLEKLDGRWQGRAASEPSSCEAIAEKQRIEATGARVANGILWAGPIGVAMSRALGDLALRPFGLLAEPELSEFSDTTEGFLVLVSDGLSDVLSAADAAQIAASLEEDKSGLSIPEVLVAEARRRWQADLPLDVRIDDTTAVVIPLLSNID